MSCKHDNAAYQKRVSKSLSRRPLNDFTYLQDSYDNLKLLVGRIDALIPTFDKRLSELEAGNKEFRKEFHAFKIWILCVIGSICVAALTVAWNLYSHLDAKIETKYEKIIQKHETAEGKMANKNMPKPKSN